MCDPLSIALTTAAVSAGSATLGFSAEKQQAAGARAAAGQNFALAYNADADRNVQISAQKSENTVDALIAKAQAQGRISASAGSLGIADATVAAQSNAAGFDIGRQASINDLNSQNQGAEVLRDISGAEASRQAKIKANQGPGYLQLVFGLAKAGLQGAGAYTSAGGSFSK